MARLKLIALTLSFLLLSACAGELKFTPPAESYSLNNSTTVNKNKDEVWKTIVPQLGKSFFVINNLDKESGIINVSYSGNPENYVDCGRIYSYVKNARGERTYDFPASRGHQQYEVMEKGEYYTCDRKIDCEGRINVIVQEISSNETQISINIKYVLTKTARVSNAMGDSRTSTDTISFVSGQQGQFRGSGQYSGTICKSNGRLEQEILSILSSGLRQ